MGVTDVGGLTVVPWEQDSQCRECWHPIINAVPTNPVPTARSQVRLITASLSQSSAKAEGGMSKGFTGFTGTKRRTAHNTWTIQVAQEIKLRLTLTIGKWQVRSFAMFRIDGEDRGNEGNKLC